MINNDRVRDMTWLASFEKRGGEKDREIVRYFKRDYVGLNLIKAFIFGTICFVIGMGLWGVYNMSWLMENMATMDYKAFAMDWVKRYAFLEGTYLVIVFIYANVTYEKARKKTKIYTKRLKRVISNLGKTKGEA